MNNNIFGYKRDNGSFGIRNHLLIISTVACANVVVNKIASQINSAKACTHPYGCDQLGNDLKLTKSTLINLGKHPNVGAVLIVGLGCEQIEAEYMANTISQTGKPVKYINIQMEHGSLKAVQKGVHFGNLLKESMHDKKVQMDLSDLSVGLQCGGSDFTSGILSNPFVGELSDFFVEHNSTVIFGETTELIGAEHLLIHRCKNEKCKKFIKEKVSYIESISNTMKIDFRGTQPSPGNIKGGITNITEKSLGAICKTGKKLIDDVINYGEIPKKSGLIFMDTPGNDLISVSGIVSGGAHIVLFTTGRGTPLGNIISPVVKITANSDTASDQADNIDIDISHLLYNVKDLDEAKQKTIDYLFKIINGDLTKSELFGHNEFGLYRYGPIL